MLNRQLKLLQNHVLLSNSKEPKLKFRRKTGPILQSFHYEDYHFVSSY